MATGLQKDDERRTVPRRERRDPLGQGPMRRPFERRAIVRLEQGQRAAADVSLPRAGAIAGRIYDATGEKLKAEVLLNHASLKGSYAGYDEARAAV